jgi:hypothetical protein
MAVIQPTKAQISYDVDGVTSLLRFHTVIAEDHEVSSEVTKYPVQTGFDVSSHVIKKNRRVSITGIISNVILTTAKENYIYNDTNNSRAMFLLLESLVKSGVRCKVSTNLDVYDDVVFTKFKTKQGAGTMDSLHFTISGEEVRTVDSEGTTVPTPVIFEPVSEEARIAKVEELLSYGIVVAEGAQISEATVDMYQSFSIEGTNFAGFAVKTTYELIGVDETTGSHNFKVHTDDTDLIAGAASNALNMFSLLDDVPALSVATACLLDGVVGIANKEIDDAIDTAFGKLESSIHGALVKTFNLLSGDDGVGQQLVNLALECVIAGGFGALGLVDADDFQKNDLKTVDDIITGAVKQGDKSVNSTVQLTAPNVLTRISEDSTPSLVTDLIG